MEDIYNWNYYTYCLTEEEKFGILNKITEEFDMKFTICAENGKLKVVFETENRSYEWESLWGCSPALSNVKYIVNQFHQQFDGSQTDMLCRHIHENKIHEIYLEKTERKKLKL